MRKNGQFRYAQSRKVSKKTVKATRLRNKNDAEEAENEISLSRKIIATILNILSFLCLLGALVALGVIKL